MTAYGFAQADAIYDFKRRPELEDTLRVTTIQRAAASSAMTAI
jgi:hypothetical protein